MEATRNVTARVNTVSTAIWLLDWSIPISQHFEILHGSVGLHALGLFQTEADKLLHLRLATHHVKFCIYQIDTTTAGDQEVMNSCVAPLSDAAGCDWHSSGSRC